MSRLASPGRQADAQQRAAIAPGSQGAQALTPAGPPACLLVVLAEGIQAEPRPGAVHGKGAAVVAVVGGGGAHVAGAVRGAARAALRGGGQHRQRSERVQLTWQASTRTDTEVGILPPSQPGTSSPAQPQRQRHGLGAGVPTSLEGSSSRLVASHSTWGALPAGMWVSFTERQVTAEGARPAPLLLPPLPPLPKPLPLSPTASTVPAGLLSDSCRDAEQTWRAVAPQRRSQSSPKCCSQ